MEKKRIMVCDDEEGIREALKLVLDDEGYDTVLSADGLECFNILKDDPTFSLVLLDIKMPQESGLDTLVKIKSQYPDTKVIVGTGYRSVDVAKEAINRGADDYIVKPFEPKEVLEKIKELLG